MDIQQISGHYPLDIHWRPAAISAALSELRHDQQFSSGDSLNGFWIYWINNRISTHRFASREKRKLAENRIRCSSGACNAFSTIKLVAKVVVELLAGRLGGERRLANRRLLKQTCCAYCSRRPLSVFLSLNSWHYSPIAPVPYAFEIDVFHSSLSR